MLTAYNTHGDAMMLQNKAFANDILPSLTYRLEFWQCSFGGERGFPLLTGTAVILNEAILNHPWTSGVLNM